MSKVKMNENETEHSSKTTMKAMRIHEYGGPEQLRYEKVPVPQVGENEVLVRVVAASVNPIDCKLASGALRPVMKNRAVALPWVPGCDFSGIVESAGKEVTHLIKGDGVYGNCPSGGAYAQYLAVEAEHLALKPETINYIDTASIPVSGQTAWQALFDHGHLHAGQTVLIHAGAGGVGMFAIQLALWKKATVIATASWDHIKFLHKLGVRQAIDYKITAFDSVVKGVDLVVDLVGGETQERSFKVIKAGGRLVSTVNPPSQEMVEKCNVHALMMTMIPSISQLNGLAELIDGEAIKAYVTKTYLLSHVQEAWQSILSGHSMGKIVLEV